MAARGNHVEVELVLCVDRRFGSHRTPDVGEWLIDSGSCYTARETTAFGRSLGLVTRLHLCAARNRTGWQNRS